MKLSHFKNNKEIIQAILDGKQIQHASTGGGPWYNTTDAADALFDDFRYHYRIKPTPTLRPWRPEEVPVGALIRFSPSSCIQGKYLILASDTTGIVHSNTPDLSTPTLCKVRYKDLQNSEHSLDHGKTWLHCGVME